METHRIGIALIIASLNLGAQSQTSPAKSRPLYPPGQPHGVGQLIVDVLPVPQSLKQLADMSSLIVEGVVEKVMPSRRGAGQTLWSLSVWRPKTGRDCS